MKKTIKIEKIDLTCNETIPELIPLKLIVKFNKEVKQLNSVKKIIDDANKVKQKLITKESFLKARDTRECKICHKIMREKPYYSTFIEKGKEICNFCSREIKIKEENLIAENKLAGQWVTLCKELNKLDKDYTLSKNDSSSSTYIFINKKSIGKKDYEFKIYLEYAYSKIYKEKTALKIGSNFYTLNADRLRKTFTSPKIAESLHKKILELYNKNEENLKGKLKENLKETFFIKQIVKDLGVDIKDIESIYKSYGGYRRNNRRFKSSNKEVLYNGQKLIVSPPNKKGDELIYSFTVTKRLNAKSLKKELKI